MMGRDKKGAFVDVDPSDDCPVCHAFKFSHEDVCRDCAEQRRIVTERKRQRARDREFGPLWPIGKD